MCTSDRSIDSCGRQGHCRVVTADAPLRGIPAEISARRMPGRPPSEGAARRDSQTTAGKSATGLEHPPMRACMVTSGMIKHLRAARTVSERNCRARGTMASRRHLAKAGGEGGEGVRRMWTSIGASPSTTRRSPSPRKLSNESTCGATNCSSNSGT
jgi:hypothetical protein